MTHVRHIAALTLLLSVSAGRAWADDWTMGGFDATLAHQSGERSGGTFANRGWSYTIPHGARIVGSPAVADGVLVAAAIDGNVYALSATSGRLLWQFAAGDGIQATPAVVDGRVFVSSLDGKLYALRLSNGRVVWQKTLGGLGQGSPVIVAGSLIVARGFPGTTLLRLDAHTGNTIWESAANTLAPFSNSAAASDGKRLIIGANEGHYAAFDMATGKRLWTYQADGIVNLAAPVLLGGRAYFLPGDSSGKVHAVDVTTGTAIAGWPIDLPAPAPDIAGTAVNRQFAVSSVAAAAGRLIVDYRIDDGLDTNNDATPDQYLMRETVAAIDATTGSVAWQQPNGRQTVTSFNDIPKYWLCPTPAAYGRLNGASAPTPLVLAASTLTSSVRAFDTASGAVLGTIAASGPFYASTVLANGQVFLASSGGTLQGWPSTVNGPPAVPVFSDGAARTVNDVAPVIHWSASMDPEGQTVTYQARLDSDGEVLESWAFTNGSSSDTTWHLPGNLDVTKSYVVAVRARDSQGAWSDWSAPQTLTVTATPPVSLGDMPQSSLAAALLAAQPGDVVHVGPGTMRLGETVRVPAGVTVQGAGPQRTIFDATGRDTGISLDGSAAQATQVIGLTVTGAHTGISVGSVRDARLTNVIVSDSSDVGINVGAAGVAILRNGTLVANGRGAISFGMLLVKNSLVMANQTGLVADHADALISQFNDVNGNVVADYQGLNAAPSDLSKAVSFLDFDKRDLHLPPKQASTDRGDPADDFSAEPAPNGGRINLGAFGGTSEAELSAPAADGTTDGGTPDDATTDGATPDSSVTGGGTTDGGTPDATPTSPTPTSPKSPAPTSPPPAAPPPAAAQPLGPGATNSGTAGGGCDVAGAVTAPTRLAGTLVFLALALLALRRGRRHSMVTVPTKGRRCSRPRRGWLLMGLLVLGAAWSAPVHAATRGQTCVGSNNSSSATSVSCTWSGTTTAGNTLLAFIIECNNGYVTPTPDGSGWSLASPQPNSGNIRVRTYYNIGAGARSGTVSWSLSGASNATLMIVEYSGITATDLANSTMGTSNTASTSATGMLGQAVEVVVGVVAMQGSSLTFSGETMTEVAEKNATDSTFGMDSAFLESITSTNTTVSSNATISGGTSANWAGVIMSFKAGSGGGGTAGLWVGGQSGNLWSTTANWSNNALPATTDAVVLNSTGNTAMVMDTDATVASFSVNSGYTNSITQSGTRNLVITGDLALAAASGTFTAPSGLMQIGGAFNKTGAITFTHNSGRVMLTSTSSKTLATNGATFNNLIINDGLIGYWKLDESTAGTAVDSSGYGNSATTHNSPTASTTVPTLGFRDPYSVAFTGTNGNNTTTPYLATGTMPAVLQPTIVTMSAWYRSGGVASSGGEVISGSNRYGLRVFSSTQIKVTKQSSTNTWVELTATVTSPTDGNWHHIAGVINGSGMIAYFDGAQVASNTDTTAIFYGTSVNNAVNGGAIGYFNIGRNQDTANYEFSGNIDEARLYNRVLSATEIKSLANGRQPGTGIATQSMTGTPTIAGDLVIASGTLAASTNSLTVTGNWWNYGGNYTSGSNTVTLNGSGTNYILSSGQTFSHLIFSGSGSMTLADRLETDPGSVLDITGNGTFGLGEYTLRTGDINRNGTTTITPSTGRVVFDSNAARTIDTGTYNNLNIEPVTATELVGYWKMDDGQGTTASDYSGNGNDGTLTNGPLWLTSGLPTAISFENPSAMTFSGSTNPYVTTTATLPTALKPSVVTVSAWYKATSVDTNGGEVVSGANNYAIRVFSSTQIKVAKETGASTWVELTATVSNPLDGNWHHLAGVINGSGMYAYFDGALAGSNSDTTAIYYTGTNGLNIGRNLSTTGYQFTGSIDDVRVYNTALSATQIAALAAGTYPAGLSNVAAYTLGYNSTVSGTFTQDGSTFNTSSYTMNVSGTGSASAVNSGTYTLGSAANTFSGGLTVGGNATLGMASSGGSLQVGSAKTLTINGTFNASSTGATIQTAGGAGTYYSFKVGSTATATPTLNINGLTVQNTDTNGMYINSNTSATTTFTEFDNIAFSSGTGTQLLQIYAPTLYLTANGCTFDKNVSATTTYDVTLTGNGSATETRALFGGSTCASNKTSCEAYDNDDDANTDGVGDTSATNGAVVQWITAAESDTNGTIEGFPTPAFDWKFFTYYATYVLFHDVDGGSADRIYVRDASGNAKYSWDGPSGTDFVGAPRFDTDLTTDKHYVYVATSSGNVYRLIDNGSSLVTDAGWSTNPYVCGCTIQTPLAIDSTNVYFGGSASGNKIWTVTKSSGVVVGTLAAAAALSGTAPAVWTNSSTSKNYLLLGESTHFDEVNVTNQGLVTSNGSAVGTVNGRVSVLNNKLYGADTAGTLWVLDPSTAGLPLLWSYHDNVNHSGCSSGVCAVTAPLYVDYVLNRAYYGDTDGHLYASYNSSSTTGAQLTGFPPTRPNSGTDSYNTAPFYNAGVLVAGTTTGNVYIYDVNGGSGPVLLQTYKLGTTMKVSGIGYDKTGANYEISAADATLKNGDVYYIAAVTDPTPGSN